MYLYETHLHTSPVSLCARAGARETVEYYKNAGYAGIFLTNHFIDGNIALEIRSALYEEKIEFYYSGIEECKRVGGELGLTVFEGIEMTYGGTDFLVYGITKEWCLEHHDMHKIPKSELLKLLMESGALVIQAHPYREAAYIDHIRLFPRSVQGAEVFNANRSEFENKLAEQYAENYSLLRFAGSDNHAGGAQKTFGGMAFDEPITSEADFVKKVLAGYGKPFARNEEGIKFI